MLLHVRLPRLRPRPDPPLGSHPFPWSVPVTFAAANERPVNTVLVSPFLLQKTLLRVLLMVQVDCLEFSASFCEILEINCSGRVFQV
ncbi:hypothetical protein M407DRAFT_158580 [Tulasnella calospora MUT 4182]|uniref:Uncharacterized protein n=1 Tax=Tulasnella calospora MUT 4182 TaxID=1051891 RepID=A0A0C3QR33_9AGAM|nr:hypothetical protein M407DRAFT_158580 [Tulasnella calospora MUT 4182]